MLAGLGARDGAPLMVLEAAGLRLRGVPEFVAPDPGAGWPAFFGAVHALLLAYAWGMVAAWLASRLRGVLLAPAVLALVAGVFLLDARLPALLRIAGGVPSPGQRALCIAVLVGAATLVTRAAHAAGAAPTPHVVATVTPPAVDDDAA